MKDKKKEIKPQMLETDWQKRARSRIEELSKQPYQRYPTEERFAEFPYQQQLQGTLGDYINRAPQPLHQEAESQLMGTLQGDYDPRTSPYYKSLREQALREEQEAVNRLKREGVATGMLQSSPYVRAEAELRGDTASKLSELLGGMYENERGRMIEAVPQAMEVGQYQEGQPLQTAQAISAISPILKQLMEEPKAFDYQQFKEEQAWPYAVQVPLLQQLLGYAPWYMPQYENTGIMGSGVTGQQAGDSITQGLLLGMMMSSKRFKKNIRVW
jgi:hypothetical protein